MAESRLVASPRPADLDAMHVYNAPILTEREGGVERVGADNVAYARDYIADSFAETLGGHTA